MMILNFNIKGTYYFKREVNIVYQVTSIKYCIKNMERIFSLFATAYFFTIFAQLESQLKIKLLQACRRYLLLPS